MMLPSVKPTEEIARFAFEVYVDQELDDSTYVVFANPTAGPWKTIKFLGVGGALVEVHRFGRTNPRPDLLVLDIPTTTLLVVEAKGSVDELISDAQLEKTLVAYDYISTVFKELSNPSVPRNLVLVPGMLWAASDFKGEARRCRDAVRRQWSGRADEMALIGLTNMEEHAKVLLTGWGPRALPFVRDRLARSKWAEVVPI